MSRSTASCGWPRCRTLVNHCRIETAALYEVRLEQDESVWASRKERDQVLAAMEAWQGGPLREDDEDLDI